MNGSLKPSTSKAISEDKKADSSGPEANTEKNSQQVRLSAAGAPPSSSRNVAVANRRLLAQQLIKRRRLIGQPPSTKITPSPAIKAAMGVKKKLVGRFSSFYFEHFLSVGNKRRMRAAKYMFAGRSHALSLLLMNRR